MASAFWLAAVFVLNIAAIEADWTNCFYKYDERQKVENVIDGINGSCIVVFDKVSNYNNSVEFCRKRFLDSTLLRKENKDVFRKALSSSLRIDIFSVERFWVDLDFDYAGLPSLCPALIRLGLLKPFQKTDLNCDTAESKVACQYPFRYSCGFMKTLNDKSGFNLGKPCEYKFDGIWQQNDNDHSENCTRNGEDGSNVLLECKCADARWSRWSDWSTCLGCDVQRQRNRISLGDCKESSVNLVQTEDVSCNPPPSCGSYTSSTFPAQDTKVIQTEAVNNESAEAETTNIGTKTVLMKLDPTEVMDTKFVLMKMDPTETAVNGNEMAVYLVSGVFGGVGVVFILSGLLCYAVSKYSQRRDPKPLGLMKMTPKPK